jgi:ABC-type Fe3+ transport system permease subunit/DNA-binding beta-propeller fold protein YncE
MSLLLLLNSLAVGFGTALLSLCAGIAVALVAAAGGRWRSFVLTLAAANLALPPFLAANAWLDLTANWRALASPELVAFRSLPLTAFVLATLLWPLTTFLALGAWTKLQTEHLEAEPLMRSGRLLRTLLLPSARGELGVAFVVTLALALANFTVPTLFQVRVFTEEFWIRFNTQFDTAGALRATWPLLVLPLAVLGLLRKREFLWPRRQPGLEPGLLRQQLGVLWPLALIFTAAWLGLGLAWPMAKLFLTKRTWTEFPGAIEAGWNALMNSASLAALTTTTVVVLSLAAAHSAFRIPHSAFARSIRFLTSSATAAGWILFLLPGVFLGVALIGLFNRPIFSAIYQSSGIQLAALVLRYFAPAALLVGQVMRAADTDLADAARNAGAGPWRVLRDALWPQAQGGIIAVWYAIYLLCLWDVETVVLIQPPGGETLALRIFNLLHYGHAAQVNALCVVMLGLAVIPVVGWGVFGRFKVQGSKFKVPNLERLGLWAVLGALSFGVFSGCSPQSESAETPLESKLFSAVQIIGTRGVAPGQFNKPRSLVCDREDNLYVVDMTGRVQKFSAEGKFLLQWQMPQTDLGKPKGMGLDRDGNIIVVEPHYMRVNHFTPDGKLVAQWGVKGTNAGEFILPRGIAVSSRGEFYVSEYTVVDRVQRFGALVKAKVQNPKSEAVKTVAPAFLQTWGSPGLGDGQFNRAEGVGMDAQDQLYVADSCNHRIQVFDRDGKFLRAHGQAGSTAGALSYPYDIRVDIQGLQFVCEFGNSRVSVFDAQDRLVEVIGGAGAAPGKFANPWAIAFDSKGNLYVADSQNHRVQKLMRRKNVISNQ